MGVFKYLIIYLQKKKKYTHIYISHVREHQMSMNYTETQRSTQMSDVSQQSGSSDLMVNNLIYKQPAALSLAVNRTYKKMFFQRSAYTGDKSTTMICDWNTGTSYINCDNSYLTFKVKIQERPLLWSLPPLSVVGLL